MLRPSAPTRTKSEAYECGIKAASDSRGRYTVRFYIIAILFVIFDVETIFLYPWAVQIPHAGLVRRGRGDRLPADPDRGLHLGVQEGRPGVGVTAL